MLFKNRNNLISTRDTDVKWGKIDNPLTVGWKYFDLTHGAVGYIRHAEISVTSHGKNEFLFKESNSNNTPCLWDLL